MRSRFSLKVLVAASLLGLAAGTASAQSEPQSLPAIRLQAGMHIIKAEVAQTPEQRAIGLMNRPTMAANDGMLFIFERPAKQCFWMKNTLLPLSIAFLADDGTVESIEEMSAHSLDSHCSKGPVRYALEMNKEWFAKRGVKPGAKLGGKPFTP